MPSGGAPGEDGGMTGPLVSVAELRALLNEWLLADSSRNSAAASLKSEAAA